MTLDIQADLKYFKVERVIANFLLRYDVGVYDASRQIRSFAALIIEATE